MRIIAGEFRGRRLLPPQSDVTRPITDRVKQSLFDILSPRIPGAIVFDCFAGTGSLGLECLSRGAGRACFFEFDRSAAALLRKNIQTLEVGAHSQVVADDLFEYFQGNPVLPKAGLIFLDPPYRFLTEKSAALIDLANHLRAQLSTDGVVIFRHDAADELKLPRLERFDQRTYGGMTLEFLRHDDSVVAPH